MRKNNIIIKKYNKIKKKTYYNKYNIKKNKKKRKRKLIRRTQLESLR